MYIKDYRFNQHDIKYPVEKRVWMIIMMRCKESRMVHLLKTSSDKLLATNVKNVHERARYNISIKRYGEHQWINKCIVMFCFSYFIIIKIL